jgi:hypothetical protein
VTVQIFVPVKPLTISELVHSKGFGRGDIAARNLQSVLLEHENVAPFAERRWKSRSEEAHLAKFNSREVLNRKLQELAGGDGFAVFKPRGRFTRALFQPGAIRIGLQCKSRR